MSKANKGLKKLTHFVTVKFMDPLFAKQTFYCFNVFQSKN